MITKQSPFQQSTHAPHQKLTLDEKSIEVKAPALFKVFSYVMITGAALLFVLVPLINWLASPNRLSGGVGFLLYFLIGSWFVGQGVIRTWHECNLTLRTNRHGIKLRLWRKTTSVFWSQVAGYSIDAKSEKGHDGHWISLRDEQGDVLLQWNRNWCDATSSSMAQRCDQIIQLLEVNLSERGLINTDDNYFTSLWQEMSRSQSISPDKLQVKATPVKATGWVATSTFLSAAGISWHYGQQSASLCLLFFSAPGIYLMLNSGVLEVDTHIIRYSTPLSTHQIKWEEVIQMESDSNAAKLVFRGIHKTLAVAGPGFWASNGQEQMMTFLMAQIEQRNIEIVQNQNALDTISKNTKI